MKISLAEPIFRKMSPECVKTLVLSLVFTSLVSCNYQNSPTAGSNATPGTSVSQDSLSFRITWSDYSGRGEAIRKVVDSYNSKSPNDTNIVMANGDEDLDAIETLMKSNSTDRIYVLPYRYVKYLGDKAYLSDLTSDFTVEKELIYPELWKLGMISEASYGIPWLSHSICLIYNKNLLAKAGVDGTSINSLESLTKALQQVEAATAAKGIGLVGADHNDVSWMVNQFIYGFGSSLLTADGTKVAVNNAKSKAALEFYKNVLGSFAQPTWTEDTGVEVMDHFRSQKVAFEFQGVWGVTDIQKNGNPFDVGIINLETIGLYPEVGPLMLSIPKNLTGKKREDAVQFIRYMLSKEAQEKIMDGEYSPEHGEYYPFRMPVRKDLTDSLIFRKYPQYLPFIEGFKNPSIDVPVPAWQEIKDRYYAPGLHKVMSGEMTIEDFLQTIETEGNALLAANR